MPGCRRVGWPVTRSTATIRRCGQGGGSWCGLCAGRGLRSPRATAAGKQRADVLGARLPRRAWQHLPSGRGAKGHRFYDWAWISVTGTGDDAPVAGYRWLVVRRHRSTGDLAYYRRYTTHRLRWRLWCGSLGAAGRSRRTSQTARAAPAWTSIRSARGRPGIGGPPGHARPSALVAATIIARTAPRPEGLIRLSLNETRRHLIRAILPSQLPAADADAWSTWRRQRQHRAQQAHYQRQAEREPRADRFGRAEA
jgi:hypothetical protein